MEKVLEITIDRKKAFFNSIGGELLHNGIKICYTLERSWFFNKNNVSCVPNGFYSAYIRDRGDKEWRIEFLNVPNRPNIQIHRGNSINDSKGCILIGNSLLPERLMDSTGAWEKFNKVVTDFFGTTDLAKLRNSRVLVHVRGVMSTPLGDFPTIKLPDGLMYA